MSRSKIWHISLRKSAKGYVIRVAATPDPEPAHLSAGMRNGPMTWKFNNITHQAAVRRFIKGTLPGLAVMMDDGANEVEDSQGKDGKRYARNMISRYMERTDTGVGIRLIVEKE